MSAGRREHRYGPVVRWAWLALMGLVVSGCNAAQVLVASPGDYASYRRIRLATNLDDKLSAAAAYLQRHPEGRYARRIRRYVAYAEPIYFRVRRRSPKGLQAYLAALPDGPNRQQALGELTKMRRQRGESSAERLARRSTIRLKFESEDRARAAATVGFWVSQLMAPRTWAGRFARSDAALLSAYRLVGAQPQCEERGSGWLCRKPVTRAFVVRNEGEGHDVRLELRVELSFDSSWRLQTARLHGQGLLRATWMAENGVLTPQKGEQATTEAFESLQGDVSRALEAKRVSCESLASPAVGQRCGKVRWRLISSGGAKDEIVIDHPK